MSTLLANARCLPRESMIRHLLFRLKTSSNDIRSRPCFHTASISRKTVPAVNRSITDSTSSNTFQSNCQRAASTDATWNESCLPEKIQSLDEYKQLYSFSIKDPNRFWTMAAERLDWYRFPTTIQNTEFDYRTQRGVDIKWYEDGVLNACYNCLDRHIEYDHGIAEQTAYIFEPDAPSQSRYHVTYGDLLTYVKKFANVLKKHGVKKGDRVTIYMPMMIEACVAFLACARIGAVHSVVFAGFSADHIAERVADCDSEVVITSDFGIRGGKSVLLKNKVNEALKMKQCQNVKTVLVFGRNQGLIKLNKEDTRDSPKMSDWTKGRDFWVHEEMEKVSERSEPERMNAEDPLFILYTSGSTGKPKGILHTIGGYLTHTSITFKHVFNYQPGDVYMCTADVGWVTGHSYSIYGPLSNRATSVIFEGIPTYPDVSRYWNIIDKHQVNIFYTVPTALRSLMTHDDAYVTNSSRRSLKVLGTVGEPINPEAWKWYHKVVGDQRCPIVDTWWQTETGGMMIAPIANAWDLEPGVATLPYFGIQTQLFDNTTKKPLSPPNVGELCVADSWPGQARTLYRNHERFVDVYFKKYPGYYFSGDGCEIKENGYHRITGRVDGVLIISGHNIGIMEVEAAITRHPSVSEAAVVGYPDPQKTQGMYCFVTLKSHVKQSEQLRHEIIQLVRNSIGAHVIPDIIHFASDLPKTRSGKIMRRILQKIVEPDVNNLGDISTLNNPDVVEDLIQNSPRTKSA